jgi:hypothetical protein
MRHAVFLALASGIRGAGQLKNTLQDLRAFKRNFATDTQLFPFAPCSDLVVALVWPDWSLS